MVVCMEFESMNVALRGQCVKPLHQQTIYHLQLLNNTIFIFFCLVFFILFSKIYPLNKCKWLQLNYLRLTVTLSVSFNLPINIVELTSCNFLFFKTSSSLKLA